MKLLLDLENNVVQMSSSETDYTMRLCSHMHGRLLDRQAKRHNGLYSASVVPKGLNGG
jgi:hypothetical protein